MSLNILIVDDSTVVRMSIIRTLKLAEIPLDNVFQAANGQEGLDALEDNWIDMVLADINMPVMNGEEMIEKIRDNPMWKNLPILVISTEGSQTRIERLEQKGAKFIHKPFPPETIREVICEMTGIGHEQKV